MRRKILVIEDEENLGQAIKVFLEKYNYDVMVTGEGQTGMQLITNEKLDLVLTDLLLPRFHGFDICRKVKSDARLKHIPIIAMTAVYKDTVYQMEAKRIGMDDFIEKPLNFEKLLEKIENYLGPASVPEELEEKSEEEGELEKQLLELQKNYSKQLPVKIMELELMWENIRESDGSNTGELIATMRRNVHRLTGSGATFGFNDLSESAQKLEIILDGIMAEGQGSIRGKEERINILLDNMRHHPYVATELEIIQQLREKP